MVVGRRAELRNLLKLGLIAAQNLSASTRLSIQSIQIGRYLDRQRATEVQKLTPLDSLQTPQSTDMPPSTPGVNAVCKISSKSVRFAQNLRSSLSHHDAVALPNDQLGKANVQLHAETHSRFEDHLEVGRAG